MNKVKYDIHKASEVIRLDLLVDIAVGVTDEVDMRITNNLYMLKSTHYRFLRIVKEKAIK